MRPLLARLLAAALVLLALVLSLAFALLLPAAS
jgi:hypothetical protein